MAWWNNAKIKSYSDAVAVWATCRNHERGKPLTSKIRMYKKDNGVFELRHYDDFLFATIYPANFVELQDSDHIPINIYKVIPVFLNRIDRGRYRVAHTGTIPTNEGSAHLIAWGYMRKIAPEFFDGIAFDLATGECLNRKPDLKDRVNPEVSLQWKRAVREYDKGWRLRVRLGVMPAPTIPFRFADVDESFTLLATAIKEQDFSEDTLARIGILSAYHPLDADTFSELVNTHRTKLRKAFGVFIE